MNDESDIFPAEMDALLPWHQQSWNNLQARREQATLPHGLLFSGQSGLGKHRLALQLSQSLLCDTPLETSGLACQQCAACERFKAGTHPDHKLIQPEEAGKALKVDQIRALIREMDLASHYGGYRVVILEPADAMNAAAANSLLKTLEEPPQNTLLILVSSRASLLPATIRSRCQRIQFTAPQTSTAQQWLSAQLEKADRQENDTEILLSLASGAPLLARQLADSDIVEQRRILLATLDDLAKGNEDPLRITATWLKQTSQGPIHWLRSWVEDMIRYRQAGENTIINKDLKECLQNLAEKVDLEKLYSFLDKVTEAVQLAGTPVNQQMLLEGLMLHWANLPRNKEV